MSETSVNSSGGGKGKEFSEKRKSSGDDAEPPKKKIAISLSAKAKPAAVGARKPTGTFGIKIALGSQKPPEPPVVLKKKSLAAAAAFNSDSESEEEEMPLEAKMRMRNVGKNTPTASGPNSFGKSGMGFCDSRKMQERDLQQQMDAVSGDNVSGRRK